MELDDFVLMTKALADCNRVRALMALQHGELCVCQIVELLKLAPSTVSKHMSILKQAKLVSSVKDGRWIHYKISRVSAEVSNIIELSIKALADSEKILADQLELGKIKKCNLEEICRRIAK